MKAADKTSTPLARIDWLNAAIQTLNDAGIAAVSIVQLASTLGVTRGSFYHHFTDREDLLRAMLNHWEKKWTVDIREEVRSLELPPGEMVLALVQSIRTNTYEAPGSQQALKGATDENVISTECRPVPQAICLSIQGQVLP